MKLKLDEKSSHSEDLLERLAKILPSLNLDEDKDTKDVVDVIAEYLSCLWKHTREVLINQYGQGGFDSLRKELVVTVPAVWSERAKDKTIQAVEKAKFDTQKISIVTEPEAAVVYTLKGIMESSQKSEVSVSDMNLPLFPI
jgi:molecular chaperone DnaK (HSP70)